ncbi:DUF2484 family protein [Pseudooceanicola nanhaiensis]|uniref:DUF2484 family protein n=1 Tax=Pseudooceanicola nanhaiensis TaxID=375761 RepID=UPI001CD40AAB|nr:DUF2484 family protein [Pseudooceanicola nanhaiensis]MCA0921124.1 DUF2484 family protein [Pseudooceanicola nanhaiensis]
MSPALVAACLWVLAAAVAGMIPSRDNHWTWAYALMAAFVPVLLWVLLRDGWVWALVVLACGLSVFRWPVIYLLRWLKAR